jgi:hypothetical protein
MAARRVSKRELEDVLLAQEEASRIVGQALQSEMRGGRSLRPRANLKRPRNCYADALLREALSDHSYEKNLTRRAKLVRQSKDALAHAWVHANDMFEGLEEEVKQALGSLFVEIEKDDSSESSDHESESSDHEESDAEDESSEESDAEGESSESDAEGESSDDEDDDAESYDEDDDEDEDDAESDEDEDSDSEGSKNEKCEDDT